MKNFLLTIQDWSSKSKLNSIVYGIVSTILVFLPFLVIILIIISQMTDSNEAWMMILCGLTFIAFIVSYVFFTKFMNKLKR